MHPQTAAILSLARSRAVARRLCILSYDADGAQHVHYMSDAQTRDSLLYRLSLNGQATAIALSVPELA